MTDDDRFRAEDSPYRNSEVVALAVVGGSDLIDWSGPETRPKSTVWVPEELFQALAAGSILGSLDVYAQSRLTRE